MRSSPLCSPVSLKLYGRRSSSNYVAVRSDLSPTLHNSNEAKKKSSGEPPCAARLCSCGRRHFVGAAATSFFPNLTSKAADLQYDYKVMLDRIHPPRPDWYEDFYASVMNTSMQPFEEEIAGYKSRLFTNLRGKVKKVLEIGIGTGPNLKYYANDSGVQVVGVDPNLKMEKYAEAAAVAAGLPLKNFNFIQAVGEALPLGDASVDAVVGTLVLCSVKDVDKSLKEVKRVLKPGGLYLFVEHVAAKDGTVARVVQSVLDPLQQIVSDGCHLTRETGRKISEAGFSGVHISTTSLSSASVIFPLVYGMACK